MSISDVYVVKGKDSGVGFDAVKELTHLLALGRASLCGEHQQTSEDRWSVVHK